MSIDIKHAKSLFQQEFGGPAQVIVRAPGRVNIIGEHTDYNHGFVLPMAIERETLIVARPRPDRALHAVAANLNRRAAASLDLRVRNAEEPWMDYLMGVGEEVHRLGRPLGGADLLILGDVPLGCGLSSSAALEMAALCLFETLGGFQLEGPEAARLGKRVENDFLGLGSGIMDQFISRCGQCDHALFLDCRSLEYRLVPMDFPDAVFVIANTCCARGLTASKYNERVAECRDAAEALRARFNPDATHLRDFTLAQLESLTGVLPDVPFRRARHVITEDVRTREACGAMQQGDAARLGQLMNASGDSLRLDYEVTSVELDAMTEAARAIPGCFGARMTGAGFGGCTINLVERSAAEPFIETLMAAYKTRTGTDGEALISRPADGAGPVAV